MSSALLGVVALTVVLLLALGERSRKRSAVAATSWPWLIGVVERELEPGGTDLPTATVRACLTGPPPLRSAAVRAVRAAEGSDALCPVAALRDAVASAAGDRLFGTIAAVHVRMAPPAAALVRARAAASVAAENEDECAAVGAGATAARWLLLAPVVPAAGGHLPGAAGLGAAAFAVLLWWGAGRWLHAGREMRVFAVEPLGRRL